MLEKHHDLLLRVAQHLAGSAEGGMELFQQNLLNCHDAIRRMPNGFTGDRYEFYLLASLKNLHRRTVKDNLRTVRVDFQVLREQGEWANSGRYEDGRVGEPEFRYDFLTQAQEGLVELHLSGQDEFTALADKVMQRARISARPTAWHCACTWMATPARKLPK